MIVYGRKTEDRRCKMVDVGNLICYGMPVMKVGELNPPDTKKDTRDSSRQDAQNRKTRLRAT
jgi:hypothetical protein